MDLSQKMRLLSLVKKLFIDRAAIPSVIPFYPQKTALSPIDCGEGAFVRTSPEAVGIESAYLQSFLYALENGSAVNMHSVYMLVDGKEVLSASAPGYSVHTWHITHSMAKSLTALALGCLYDEGKLSLDETLLSIFPEMADALAKGKKSGVTVKHLLTMQVNTAFNEAGTVVETDWLRGYFSAPLREPVGTSFAYNSLSTYVLSAILEKKSGMGLSAYIDRKLFSPMGIRFHAEKCPMGRGKGGFGFYLAPADMAKIGMLVLDRGVYKKRRYISEEYMKMMTAVQVSADESYGSYDYGFQTWVDAARGSILFNGMLGQNILVIPRTRTVLVLTAQNGELFQVSEMLSIAAEYFADAERAPHSLPLHHGAEKALRAAEKHFFEGRAFARTLPPLHGYRALFHRLAGRSVLPEDCALLDGKSYFLPENNEGVLPLFHAVMQNSYEGGITKIGFSYKKDVGNEEFFLEISTPGASHRIPVGFYRPKLSTVRINGEPYRVAASGRFTSTEDDEPVLKINLSFSEIAGEKHIKVFYGKTPRLFLGEVPGYAVAEAAIGNFFGKESTVGRLIKRQTDMAFNAWYSLFDMPAFFRVDGTQVLPVGESEGTPLVADEEMPVLLPESTVSDTPSES